MSDTDWGKVSELSERAIKTLAVPVESEVGALAVAMECAHRIQREVRSGGELPDQVAHWYQNLVSTLGPDGVLQRDPEGLYEDKAEELTGGERINLTNSLFILYRHAIERELLGEVD